MRSESPDDWTGVQDATHSRTEPGVEVIVEVKPGRPLLSAGRDLRVGIGAALLAVEMIVVKVVGPDRVVVENYRVGLRLAHLHEARAGYVDDRCCAAEETVREEAPAVPRGAVCQTNHHGHHRYRLSIKTKSNVKLGMFMAS